MTGINYRGSPVDLSQLRVGEEIELPKRDTFLTPIFEETELGDPKGAEKQYRGPLNSHLRDYGGHYTLHRDRVDPRTDPLGHLFHDAPDELVNLTIAGICAYGAGKAAYESSNELDAAPVNALIAGGLVGLGTYALAKLVTSLLKD